MPYELVAHKHRFWHRGGFSPLLLVFGEMMGVPNPAAYYTLELQPLLLERFHDWHRRMGMEHSPLDHFRCC